MLKSTRIIASELTAAGCPVSAQKVCGLLHAEGFSLQGTSRVKEGASHPDRNAQFEYIAAKTKDFMARGVPVVSVDAKKKELVGNYANAGREWHPKGMATEVLTYNFADDAVGKAIPYGIYDIANNSGYVNVGMDHDTPTFAVRSLAKWWDLMGSVAYPGATELFVTADGGGSNSSRSRRWKLELQKLADKLRLTIHVSHFPPGTSKWNKIEHRLFSFITINWRGRPLISYETVVCLISGTRTAKGLRVHSELDTDKYPLGQRVSADAMANLALKLEAFHGDWNYTLSPRSPQEVADSEEVKAKGQPQRTEEDWAKLVAQQSRGQVDSKEFCFSRGINHRTFCEWRRRLAPRPSNADWDKLCKEQLALGISATEFCRRKGLPYKLYIRWLKRLRGGVSERAKAKWRKVIDELENSKLNTTDFAASKGIHRVLLSRWKVRLAKERAILRKQRPT